MEPSSPSKNSSFPVWLQRQRIWITSTSIANDHKLTPVSRVPNVNIRTCRAHYNCITRSNAPNPIIKYQDLRTIQSRSIPNTYSHVPRTIINLTKIQRQTSYWPFTFPLLEFLILILLWSKIKQMKTSILCTPAMYESMCNTWNQKPSVSRNRTKEVGTKELTLLPPSPTFTQSDHSPKWTRAI